MSKNRIALLGATGSIGTSCLDVIAAHPDSMELTAASCHRRWAELSLKTAPFAPPTVVISDDGISMDRSKFPAGTKVLYGSAGLEQVASSPDVDTVVAAIVGAAGLRSSYAAVASGKRLAIANKETLVMAGPLIVRLAAETGAQLLPVDSEHSAVFQALACGRRSEVRRVILTASGGPFREATLDQLAHVTPKQALAHPTWNMGPKITIDSATMMNKALEIVEARWLFNLSADQISVVIHPQSLIHSLVEFCDGSVIAQLSPPDMRLPIQYALTHPHRTVPVSTPFPWDIAQHLDLYPPDEDRFPALALGFDVARRGGTCGTVLNAANEIAVDRFLSGTLSFRDIPNLCRTVLLAHDFDPDPNFDEVLRLDHWSRAEALRWTS